MVPNNDKRLENYYKESILTLENKVDVLTHQEPQEPKIPISDCK